MNLSVLIPIYNFDCRKLVNKLYAQCQSVCSEFEIICIDDGSDFFLIENREINLLEKADFTELGTNIGRSKIRNKLGKTAQYENLLFMDCDSDIDDNFIINYLTNVVENTVLVGGRLYLDVPPDDKKYYLHWKYGKNKEPKPAENAKAFTSNNFFIPKKLFLEILFDETINGYGHEDTLFGITLKNKGFDIKNIYNPVYHIGLSDCNSFIANSLNAVKNIKGIVENKDGSFDFENVTLIRYYRIINGLKLNWFFAHIYTKGNQYFVKNFKSLNPNLFLFNIYKISYLCSLK